MRVASIAFLAWSLVTGCTAPGPQPCLSPGVCPRGTECLANRCVATGALPASGRVRIVSQPRRLAVLDGNGTAELPAAATLGGEARDALLYLAFEPLSQLAGPIDSAFLLLEPLPATRSSQADIEVSVWRVLDDWKPETLTRRTRPRLGLPASRGIARGSPPLRTRIDVTELAEYARRHPATDHGWALKAEHRESFGISIATGLIGAPGPRLEVYLRDEQPAADLR